VLGPKQQWVSFVPVSEDQELGTAGIDTTWALAAREAFAVPPRQQEVVQPQILVAVLLMEEQALALERQRDVKHQGEAEQARRRGLQHVWQLDAREVLRLRGSS
jgi:hypothetical protein